MGVNNRHYFLAHVVLAGEGVDVRAQDCRQGLFGKLWDLQLQHTVE